MRRLTKTISMLLLVAVVYALFLAHSAGTPRLAWARALEYYAQIRYAVIDTVSDVAGIVLPQKNTVYQSAHLNPLKPRNPVEAAKEIYPDINWTQVAPPAEKPPAKITIPAPVAPKPVDTTPAQTPLPKPANPVTAPAPTPSPEPATPPPAPAPAPKPAPVPVPVPAPKQETPPATQGPSDQSQSYAQKVVELVNKEREKEGLKALTVSAKLAEVAWLKSKDLHDNKYFSHTSPVYGSPFEMMRKFNITYMMAAENIAAGQTSPEAVVAAWMKSEGHRINILNPDLTQIGVGYFYGPNEYKHYWTQMFITPK